jgi:hypothetical protein
MANKALLIVLAIIGTLVGWVLTDNFIITIGIGQFLLIELTITVMHELYNLAKADVIKKS